MPQSQRDGEPIALAKDMLRLEGGFFLMGSEGEEAWPQDGEGPVREITLDPFWIDRTTVIANQYSADTVTLRNMSLHLDPPQDSGDTEIDPGNDRLGHVVRTANEADREKDDHTCRKDQQNQSSDDGGTRSFLVSNTMQRPPRFSRVERPAHHGRYHAKEQGEGVSPRILNRPSA